MALPPADLPPRGVGSTTAPAQFISFAIGDDQYGVDIMAVREIKGWSDITHLPKQPEYVRGVLNLRGVIVPIIDLRCRFGQGLTEATPTAHRHHRADRRAAGRPARRPRARHRLARTVADSAGAEDRAGLARRFPVRHSSPSTSAMIALIDLKNLLTFASDDRNDMRSLQITDAA